MEIVKTFGNYIEKWCETSPERARWLLKTGWEAQNLKFRFLPEGQLNPSDQYLAGMMMNVMTQPLKHPESSVMVSVFTPCELLQEAGLYLRGRVTDLQKIGIPYRRYSPRPA